MNFTLNIANPTIAAHLISASRLILKDKKKKFLRAMRVEVEKEFIIKDAIFTKVIKEYAYIYISIK